MTSSISIVPMSKANMGEEFSGIEFQDIYVPKFKIPNWPKGVGISLKLSKRPYHIPVESDGKYLWYRNKHRLFVEITGEGFIRFQFLRAVLGLRPAQFCGSYASNGYTVSWLDVGHYWVDSGADDLPRRLPALMLFDQFKVNILLELVSKLKNDSAIHNQVVEEVKKAFEPFVPFVVMDQLLS